MHWLCATILRKNIRRDASTALFNSQLPQKIGCVVADVDHTGGSICFGCVLENTLAALLGGRIDQVIFNRDRFILEIDGLPAKPTDLSAAAARIDDQRDIRLPFERFIFQAFQNMLHFLDGKGFDLRGVFGVSFIASGLFDLLHRI